LLTRLVVLYGTLVSAHCVPSLRVPLLVPVNQIVMRRMDSSGCPNEISDIRISVPVADFTVAFAHTALNAALERDIKDLRNPIQPSDENLIAGVHLYVENCVVCHGALDGRPSNPAQGFYIEAPQLAKDGVEDDPEAASFWKVKHGIRFTAMPSFTTTLQDEGDLENRDVPQADG
jgi:mono/diheme cytochrome c family protein